MGASVSPGHRLAAAAARDTQGQLGKGEVMVGLAAGLGKGWEDTTHSRPDLHSTPLHASAASCRKSYGLQNPEEFSHTLFIAAIQSCKAAMRHGVAGGLGLPPPGLEPARQRRRDDDASAPMCLHCTTFSLLTKWPSSACGGSAAARPLSGSAYRLPPPATALPRSSYPTPLPRRSCDVAMSPGVSRREILVTYVVLWKSWGCVLLIPS